MNNGLWRFVSRPPCAAGLPTSGPTVGLGSAPSPRRDVPWQRSSAALSYQSSRSRSRTLGAKLSSKALCAPYGIAQGPAWARPRIVNGVFYFIQTDLSPKRKLVALHATLARLFRP